MIGKIVLLALLIGVAIVLVRRLGKRTREEIPLLLQDGRFEEAFTAAAAALEKSDGDATLWTMSGQAALMTGRFSAAADAFRRASDRAPRDPSPREGLALALSLENAHDETAIATIEETARTLPAIQEFQALRLAHLLLRAGRSDDALRIFDDNLVLLQTRFEMDYTDPDPMLADTLYEFAVLSAAAGDTERAATLRRRIVEWAPASVFASWCQDSES